MFSGQRAFDSAEGLFGRGIDQIGAEGDDIPLCLWEIDYGSA